MPRTQRRSFKKWFFNRQINKFALPSPGSINCKLPTLPKLLFFFLLKLFPNFFYCLQSSFLNFVITIKQPRKKIGNKFAMMIILVIEITYPNFKMAHKFLPYLGIAVSDECCQIVDIVGRLVKLFDRYWIRIPEPNQILKNECIVFPQTAPKDSC